MSKQSEAKASQNYTPKAHNCGDCRNLKFDITLPAWMVQNNLELVSFGKEPRYTVEKNGVEKNIRCGIGGFAVKKMGICGKHMVAS